MKRRLEDRKHHIIYRTTRLDGSGRYYVGVHSTDCIDDGYLGSGTVLAKSIRKYGKDMHHCRILEHLPSRAAAIEREKQVVTQEMLTDPLCMNLVPGGTYLSRKPEHISSSEKRRQSVIAFYASDKSVAARQKISEANSGRKATAAAKANMSIAAKHRMGRMKADGSWELVKAKNAATATGKKQSIETITKRVLAVAAYKKANGGKRTFSATAKANISKAQLGNEKRAQEWCLEELETGKKFVIKNRTKWLRDNNLVITRDRLGIKRYKEKQLLYRLEQV